MCISACDGSLSISSSHMTPVTHHTPRRSRNKPAITRQTGETEIPAPHRGLQQQTDTVQTDNPAKSSAAARSLPAVLMREQKERRGALRERQNSPRHGKTSSDRATRQSETVPSLKQQRHFLARRTGCVMAHAGARAHGAGHPRARPKALRLI